jgi:hypothetical protein
MKRDRRHRRPLAVPHLVIAAAGRAAASTVPIDVCERGVLNPIFNQSAMRVVEDGVVAGATTGEWMPLYRFDMSEGSSMRPWPSRSLQPSRAPRFWWSRLAVVDSVEFHAPVMATRSIEKRAEGKANADNGLALSIVVAADTREEHGHASR